MDIQIKVTDAECVACLEAIRVLGKLEHVKYMSLKMIALHSKIKATKVRHVVASLHKNSLVSVYQATTNPTLQRYYYNITAAGEAFIAAYEAGEKND